MPFTSLKIPIRIMPAALRPDDAALPVTGYLLRFGGILTMDHTGVPPG